MSQEINNNIVVMTLIVAIVISLGGTVVVLNKLSSISQIQGITGFAADDTGDAKITIQSNLGIEVDSGNNSIQFGTCNIPTTGTVTINSSMNETELNSTSGFNCTGSNVPSFIKIQNIGNTNANVTIRSDSIGSDLLTSADAKIHFKSYNDTVVPGCSAGLVSTWTEIAAAGNQNYTICDVLTFNSSYPAIKVYLNLTIPWDSSTGGSEYTANLQFWAEGE